MELTPGQAGWSQSKCFGISLIGDSGDVQSDDSESECESECWE